MTPKARLNPVDTGPPVPAGPPNDPSAALSDAVAKFSAGGMDLSIAFNNCVETVRIGSVHLFDSVLAGVRFMLEYVRNVVEAALHAMQYVMEHYGPALAIHVQSFNWIRNVAGPMSGIQSDMAVNARPNFEEWEGEAATYYENRIVEQRAAAKHVAASATFISDWLAQVQQQNVTYVQGLVDMVADLVAALIVAAAEAGTGYGIPDAIKTLKGKVEAIVKAVVAHIAKAGVRITNAYENARDIASKIAENDHLPRGAWPHAVTG